MNSSKQLRCEFIDYTKDFDYVIQEKCGQNW